MSSEPSMNEQTLDQLQRIALRHKKEAGGGYDDGQSGIR